MLLCVCDEVEFKDDDRNGEDALCVGKFSLPIGSEQKEEGQGIEVVVENVPWYLSLLEKKKK